MDEKPKPNPRITAALVLVAGIFLAGNGGYKLVEGQEGFRVLYYFGQLFIGCVALLIGIYQIWTARQR